MAKLDKNKQDALDAWASYVVAGKDRKVEIDPVSCEVTRPSQAQEMMALLGAELTESLLEESLRKAGKA
jgi:hypothetical protein